MYKAKIITSLKKFEKFNGYTFNTKDYYAARYTVTKILEISMADFKRLERQSKLRISVY